MGSLRKFKREKRNFDILGIGSNCGSELNSSVIDKDTKGSEYEDDEFFDEEYDENDPDFALMDIYSWLLKWFPVCLDKEELSMVKERNDFFLDKVELCREEGVRLKGTLQLFKRVVWLVYLAKGEDKVTIELLFSEFHSFFNNLDIHLRFSFSIDYVSLDRIDTLLSNVIGENVE